mgnify:CR=1 FL=1
MVAQIRISTRYTTVATGEFVEEFAGDRLVVIAPTARRIDEKLMVHIATPAGEVTLANVHLETVRERISLDGQPISDERFGIVECAGAWQQAVSCRPRLH